jgi:4-hydroxybenzoate polyprenyltransferase
MRILRSLLDIVFLSRPVLWVPVWGFSLFGYALSRRIAWNDAAWFRWSGADAVPFLLMLAFSCGVGSVYALNQIADREADRRNPGFALLVQGNVPVRHAWITAVAMAVAGIAMPLLWGAWVISILCFAAIALGAAYSFKPMRLSGRPLADFLANALGYGVVAFGAGWWCGDYRRFDDLFFLHAIPYVLLMAAGSISSTIPDIEGDRRDGKITTAVAAGETNAHILATLLLGGALLWAQVAGDATAFIAAVLAVPVYVLFLLVKRPWIREATYKVGGAAAMIVAACRFPLFAAAAILVLLATVGYFRFRFGVDYPSLLPAQPIAKKSVL